MDSLSPESLARYLRERRSDRICGGFLMRLEQLHRVVLYQDLESERIARKCGDIKTLHRVNREDWTQTLLALMLRYLGDMKNRNAYSELAQRIGVKAIEFARHDLRMLEALLICASGLLEEMPRDSFTRSVREMGRDVMDRFFIRPASSEVWERRGMLHSCEPVLRLAQVARVIHNNPSLIETILAIRTRDDLFSLFCVEASSEWGSYFRGSLKCSIGAMKSDIMGINFVVPILYFYGNFSQNDEYIDAATNLLENLPAERNGFINKWLQSGLTLANSFETQAILQLDREYCNAHDSRCLNCPLFRQMVLRYELLNKIPSLPNLDPEKREVE